MSITGVDKKRSYNGDYMKLGKEAERIVMEWLKQRPQVLGLSDFRELRAIQEADVDIAIKTQDGTVTLAEIKSDRHLGVSGNVLFELLRINHTCIAEKSCTLGWSARSPAVWFLFYASSVNKIYQCRVDDFRVCFQNYTKEKRDGAKLFWVNTDSIKSTLNCLIPWEHCKYIFTVHSL